MLNGKMHKSYWIHQNISDLNNTHNIVSKIETFLMNYKSDILCHYYMLNNYLNIKHTLIVPDWHRTHLDISIHKYYYNNINHYCMLYSYQYWNRFCIMHHIKYIHIYLNLHNIHRNIPNYKYLTLLNNIILRYTKYNYYSVLHSRLNMMNHIICIHFH